MDCGSIAAGEPIAQRGDNGGHLLAQRRQRNELQLLLEPQRDEPMCGGKQRARQQRAPRQRSIRQKPSDRLLDVAEQAFEIALIPVRRVCSARQAMIEQCLRAGAAGFVTKSSAPEVLVDAVRRAARGETALSPDVATIAAAPSAAPHRSLSSREFDILQQLLAGHGVDEIAQTLRLSAKTVSNYQTQIRQKLGVGSAVELLRYAREHGLTAA